MGSLKENLRGSQEENLIESDKAENFNKLKGSTMIQEDQKGGRGGGNLIEENQHKEIFEENKVEDEDKKILMELIAQNNQKLEVHQDIIEQISLNQGSQISLSRMKSQPSDSIHITQSQLQQNDAVNANVIPSLTNLARQRYISTEIDQQSNVSSNQNDNKNIPAQFMNAKSRYAERAAALGYGGGYNANQSQIQNTNEQVENTNQQYQIGFQGFNQQPQFKNQLPRSQIQFYSGLSSSQSLTVQRDFYIYFELGDDNSRSGSSNYESWYDLEEASQIITQATNEPIRVPIDDLHEDATVQDFILSALCQFSNFFQTHNINIRLACEENLYDLYLAKKNGEKKSQPALYPLKKIKEFSNQNMVLIPRDSSALMRPQLNNIPLKTKVSAVKNGNANEQKLTNREIIKEVSESMISNKSVDIPPPNNRNESNSFLKNKNTASFMGYPSQTTNPNTRRSIQSTITPKQTKIGIEERDQGDVTVSSPSKCLTFFCCVRGNGGSSSKTSSQSSSSKKRPTTISS